LLRITNRPSGRNEGGTRAKEYRECPLPSWVTVSSAQVVAEMIGTLCKDGVWFFKCTSCKNVVILKKPQPLLCPYY
jgi:hypothetical protein